jgi:hypothetical protein
VKVVGRARESSYSRVLTGVKQQPDNSNFSRGDAQLSPAFETQSKSYSEKHMDSPARRFAATHDMKVKEEIERLTAEYSKFKEPWRFVAV